MEPIPGPRYTDSTAVDETLYDALWDGLELVWQRTVQAVPPDRPVLVTSDHGYVLLGEGLSDPSLKDVDRPLEGKRFTFFGPDETPPAPGPGVVGGSATWACHTRRPLPQPAEGALGVPLGVSSWWIDADGDAAVVGGAGAGDLTGYPLR